MKKRKILFLGETFRADAITWMNGLKEFGNFEIVTWELKSTNNGINRLKRILEFLRILLTFKKQVRQFNADMVIAERTTSYGFLAAISGVQPIAIAQQGITDLWPKNSILLPVKKILQDYAFKKANLIHAWGPIIAIHIEKSNVDKNKVMILPKGINLDFFKFNPDKETSKINAIVTRSLLPDYKHDIILRAFAILKQRNVNFVLTIVGDGILLEKCKLLSQELKISDQVVFTGRINNNDLPKLLQEATIYISMPTTEGVSASLFEAMACGCFPIVTDLPGNRSWINHKENGILVPSEDFKKLASEIEWTFTNEKIRNQAIIQNRDFVRKNANYALNMKIIADAYHELINFKEVN